MLVLLDDQVADKLDDADDDKDHDDGDPSHIGHVPVMAILNGEVAQAAGANSAGHGGQTHQADGCDGGTPCNGGDALPQVHSEDDLQGAGAHGQDRFDEAVIQLSAPST